MSFSLSLSLAVIFFLLPFLVVDLEGQLWSIPLQLLS